MRRAILIPSLVAALGAALYLLVAPPSADLAAQEYRADLGLVLWNNGWYAGHHTPGYSLLSPLLGGTLGVRLAGALAAVAAAALFAPLAHRHWSDPRAAAAAALWFAAGTAAVLLTGRLTFLLGVAIGLGALLALAHDRRALAAVLALLTTLASPVAGLFVALGVVAWALARRERRRSGAAIAVAALAPVAIMLALFPQGGSEPFVASAFWPALAATLLVAALLPAGERTLRIAALLYAVALVMALAIATPLGGNASRLGALAAGPILLGALVGRRSSLLLAALAAAFAYWPLYPAVRDVVRAAGDPSLAGELLRPAARVPELAPRRRRLPDRDPLHAEPLGGASRRAPDPARARVGAPARPPPRRALLRRQPRRVELSRLARQPRRRLRRGARRPARRRRPRRGAADRCRSPISARGLERRALARLRRQATEAARRRRDRNPQRRRHRAARAARRRRARPRAPHALVARDQRSRVRPRGSGRADQGSGPETGHGAHPGAPDRLPCRR